MINHSFFLANYYLLTLSFFDSDIIVLTSDSLIQFRVETFKCNFNLLHRLHRLRMMD